MLKRLYLTVLLFCTLFIAGTLVWLAIPYGFDKEAVKHALVSDREVNVTQGRFQVFRPTNKQPLTGLIFYPGGRAAPESYAPLLKQLSATGLVVVNVPMPLHMAIFAPDRADDVMEAFPDIDDWYLAGHSMGGVAAVEYTAEHASLLRGLIMWASYPDRDISQIKISTLSVYGTRDKMTTVEEVQSRKRMLPEQTEYIAIDADHWLFGHFARGAGSGEAQAERDRLQQELVDVTRDFIARGR